MREDRVPEVSKEPLRIELVPQKSGAESRWKHPLVITLFSFVLTGIIGAIISYQIQRRNAEIDRNAKQYEASTTAIAEFSDALYTRYVRAGFLDSALKRRADKQEVADRKKLYDEAVIAQESGLFGKELLIREALLEYQYSSFESLYDSRVRPVCSIILMICSPQRLIYTCKMQRLKSLLTTLKQRTTTRGIAATL